MTPRERAVVKSEERVFLPNRKDPIVLPQNSTALFLLVRIRDEAHRFAITYNRELRRRARLRSVLDDIEGIGPVKAARVAAPLSAASGGFARRAPRRSRR